MNKCPKCSSNKIMGPTFIKAQSREFLQYICSICGYSENKPCNDNKAGGKWISPFMNIDHDEKGKLKLSPLVKGNYKIPGLGHRSSGV